MGAPVSVRLDDEVQATLEGIAAERGIGLSTLLRELAAGEARRVRRERIRRQSREVAAHIEASPEARAFHRDWCTPAAPADEGR
jgi:predicted transcriptional regulator